MIERRSRNHCGWDVDQIITAQAPREPGAPAALGVERATLAKAGQVLEAQRAR